jgi:hypothetical protein
MLGSASTVTRWDRLLGQKPVPLREHLLDEAARLLRAELAAWPLAAGDVDPATGSGFSDLLSGRVPRPPGEVFSEALRLARWDLERRTEAADDYFRNRRYLEAGVSEADRPALFLVTRWVVEQLLALGEATEGRLRRSELCSILDRLARAAPPPSPDPGPSDC